MVYKDKKELIARAISFMLVVVSVSRIEIKMTDGSIVITLRHSSFVFLVFFLILIYHKFRTNAGLSFAHGKKNLFTQIEFTVKMSSKSITSNIIISSFLSYFM